MCPVVGESDRDCSLIGDLTRTRGVVGVGGAAGGGR